MQVLLDSLKSKKFIVLVLGIIAIFVGVSLQVNDQTLTIIGGMIGTYQIGQGIADHGKEQVKEEGKPIL